MAYTKKPWLPASPTDCADDRARGTVDSDGLAATVLAGLLFGPAPTRRRPILYFLPKCKVMSLAKLSAKNQIVIPRDAREALGLKPGDQLLVVVRGDRVIVRQKPKAHHAAIRGLASGLYPSDYLKKERDSWT
jgi:AbrB family looped-hinge helix DNA binding protein